MSLEMRIEESQRADCSSVVFLWHRSAKISLYVFVGHYILRLVLLELHGFMFKVVFEGIISDVGDFIAVDNINITIDEELSTGT